MSVLPELPSLSLAALILSMRVSKDDNVAYGLHFQVVCFTPRVGRGQAGNEPKGPGWVDTRSNRRAANCSGGLWPPRNPSITGAGGCRTGRAVDDSSDLGHWCVARALLCGWRGAGRGHRLLWGRADRSHAEPPPSGSEVPPVSSPCDGSRLTEDVWGSASYPGETQVLPRAF